MPQKECPKSLDENSMVIFSVNIFEKLYTSTYTLSKYSTYQRPKQSPRMATLSYSHFGNPGGSYPRALIVLPFVRLVAAATNTTILYT